MSDSDPRAKQRRHVYERALAMLQVRRPLLHVFLKDAKCTEGQLNGTPCIELRMWFDGAGLPEAQSSMAWIEYDAPEERADGYTEKMIGAFLEGSETMIAKAMRE
jgi:hypothetical protein